jgi:hypothetical protein
LKADNIWDNESARNVLERIQWQFFKNAVI